MIGDNDKCRRRTGREARKSIPQKSLKDEGISSRRSKGCPAEYPNHLKINTHLATIFRKKSQTSCPNDLVVKIDSHTYCAHYTVRIRNMLCTNQNEFARIAKPNLALVSPARCGRHPKTQRKQQLTNHNIGFGLMFGVSSALGSMMIVWRDEQTAS